MVEAIDSVDRVEATPVYNDIYEAFNCTINRKHSGRSIIMKEVMYPQQTFLRE
jgi:hypothetical protein